MPLTIDVRDLGPLRQATIDLHPLTVLIGPNNTGKSFLALLTHASLHLAVRPHTYRSSGRLQRFGTRRELAPAFARELETWREAQLKADATPPLILKEITDTVRFGMVRFERQVRDAIEVQTGQPLRDLVRHRAVASQAH